MIKNLRTVCEKGYLLPLTSLLLVFLFVPAAIGAPYMDRHEIAARAHSAVNGNYYWGGESWYPFGDTDSSRTNGKGADCSGLVIKAWEVPSTFYYPFEVSGTRYTTADLWGTSSYWSQVTSPERGDIYVRHNFSTGNGHTFIYDKDSGYTARPWAYEAYNSTYGIRYWIRPAEDLSQYRIKRRALRDDTGGVIKIDNPSAAYWNEATGWRNVWSSSTANPGYIGDNYQYIYGPGQTNRVFARWTPVITARGYYHVWVKWAPAENNADNAKYVVRYRNGTLVRYRNQRDSSYVNQWSQLTTSGALPFEAGFNVNSGSVDLVARDPGANYTANGNVVADAVRFVWDRPADW